MKSRIFLNVLICIALVSLAGSLALGQGTTSRITGIVRDANGAAVGGASVTLNNEENGISFTAESSDSGTYSFDLVQVGNYSVVIEKQGFKKFISKGNAVNVNQPTTINVSLEPGGVQETVT